MKKRSQIILSTVLVSAGLFAGSQILSINAKTAEASISNSIEENYPQGERNCGDFRKEEIFYQKADNDCNDTFGNGRQCRRRANCQNQGDCLKQADCQNQMNCINQ